MRLFITLYKKELLDFTRNYKLLIISLTFLAFAFLSPLTAKLMPEIVSSFLPKEMSDAFPEPTAYDSWAQFFKNFSQMGLFIVVLIFGSILSNERQKGTLIILFTKGLSRSKVILSKFIFALTIWTITYYAAFAIVYFYTTYYWPKDSPASLGLAVFNLWLFGIFLLALLIFSNVLFRSFFSTLLITVGVIILAFIIDFFPKLEHISLLRLAAENNAILQGQFHWSDYTILILITAALIIALITAAIQIFNRKVI